MEGAWGPQGMGAVSPGAARETPTEPLAAALGVSRGAGDRLASGHGRGAGGRLVTRQSCCPARVPAAPSGPLSGDSAYASWWFLCQRLVGGQG